MSPEWCFGLGELYCIPTCPNFPWLVNYRSTRKFRSKTSEVRTNDQGQSCHHVIIMLSSCLVIMSAIFSWAKSAIAWCWVTICVSIHKNIPRASLYLLVKSYHGWPIAAWQQPHQTNAMNPPLTATWCYTGLSKKVDSKLGDLVKSLV